MKPKKDRVTVSRNEDPAASSSRSSNTPTNNAPNTPHVPDETDPSQKQVRGRWLGRLVADSSVRIPWSAGDVVAFHVFLARHRHSPGSLRALAIEDRPLRTLASTHLRPPIDVAGLALHEWMAIRKRLLTALSYRLQKLVQDKTVRTYWDPDLNCDGVCWPADVVARITAPGFLGDAGPPADPGHNTDQGNGSLPQQQQPEIIGPIGDDHTSTDGDGDIVLPDADPVHPSHPPQEPSTQPQRTAPHQATTSAFSAASSSRQARASAGGPSAQPFVSDRTVELRLRLAAKKKVAEEQAQIDADAAMARRLEREEQEQEQVANEAETSRLEKEFQETDEKKKAGQEQAEQEQAEQECAEEQATERQRAADEAEARRLEREIQEIDEKEQEKKGASSANDGLSKGKSIEGGRLVKVVYEESQEDQQQESEDAGPSASTDKDESSPLAVATLLFQNVPPTPTGLVSPSAIRHQRPHDSPSESSDEETTPTTPKPGPSRPRTTRFPPTPDPTPRRPFGKLPTPQSMRTPCRDQFSSKTLSTARVSSQEPDSQFPPSFPLSRLHLSNIGMRPGPLLEMVHPTASFSQLSLAELHHPTMSSTSSMPSTSTSSAFISSPMSTIKGSQGGKQHEAHHDDLQAHFANLGELNDILRKSKVASLESSFCVAHAAARRRAQRANPVTSTRDGNSQRGRSAAEHVMLLQAGKGDLLAAVSAETAEVSRIIGQDLTTLAGLGSEGMGGLRLALW